jgi:IstB-like ATP binding protein
MARLSKRCWNAGFRSTRSTRRLDRFRDRFTVAGAKDDRHDRGSTVIATQIPVDRWHTQIGDPTYADAILDRLVHNAYRIELRGDSIRRPQPSASVDEKNYLNK